MVEAGSSILFSSPVMKIILYNRQLPDDFFHGNSHMEKKKIIFFTIQFGIVLRLQTNGKNTILKTAVPR